MRRYRVHRVSEETIIVEAESEEAACDLAEEMNQHDWTFDIVKVYAEEIAEVGSGETPVTKAETE